MAKQAAELDFHDTRRIMAMMFMAGITVLIKSGPGQGKSSLAEQYARKQGPDYGYFELNCALANQPDFMGWFYKNTEKYNDVDGTEVTIDAGRYTYPYFFFDKFTGRPLFTYKRGLLVFEEYGQCELDLKRALGQAFLDRRVGQWKVPKGFDILCLSNRDIDRSAVTRDYDFLINRRDELNMKSDLENWLLFAQHRQMLNATMAFASMPTHGVFNGEVPKEQGPWLTPRSLDNLDKFVAEVQATNTPIEDPAVRIGASGLVGSGSAHQYIAFMSLRDKIPSVANIIKDPKGTSVPTSPDQQMFLIFNMADKADKKNITPLATYLSRLPSDMSVAFYRTALTRDNSLMSVPEFGKWAVQNKTLLALVNSRQF